MIPHIGTTELIIILVIIVLLFGVGRISKVAGEIGKGLRSFRDNLSGKDEKKDQDDGEDEDQKED